MEPRSLIREGAISNPLGMQYRPTTGLIRPSDQILLEGGLHAAIMQASARQALP